MLNAKKVPWLLLLISQMILTKSVLSFLAIVQFLLTSPWTDLFIILTIRPLCPDMLDLTSLDSLLSSSLPVSRAQ